MASKPTRGLLPTIGLTKRILSLNGCHSSSRRVVEAEKLSRLRHVSLSGRSSSRDERAPGVERHRVRAAEAGETALHLENVRPWERGGPRWRLACRDRWLLGRSWPRPHA